MHQAGLIEMWTRRHKSHNSCSRKSGLNPRIQAAVQDISGSFVVYAAGLGLAFITFLLEISFKRLLPRLATPKKANMNLN